MLLAHSPDGITGLRAATLAEPWRVLVSGCLAGWHCGVDGTDYGMSGSLAQFLALPTLQVIAFCPEQHAMGTPRTMPDIHGGDGHDVLDGKARVKDEKGEDLTEKMVAGANAMLAEALRQRVELALLTDMSGACGSQVISEGCRFDEPRRYQAGVGVATALLLRNGIPVVSQRDHKTLGRLRELLDPGFMAEVGAIDHHETAWFTQYFAKAP